MIRKPIRRSWSIGLGIAAFLLLVLSYTVLSEIKHAGNPDDRTIPRWSQLWDGVLRASTPDEASAANWMGEGDPPTRIWLVDDAKATLVRLFGGLAVGVVLSIILGMLMGTYSVAESFLLPPLSFLAKIPPTAMMAVFFVLAGVGFKMYVTMIAFGVMPTLTQSVYLTARRDVPEELVNKTYALGASSLEVIWNVIFRQVLPGILDAVRLQIGPAMVYLIAAEMLVASVGMGYRIRLQQRLLDMSVPYYYLVLLGVFGLLMDYAIRLLVRKVSPWYAKTT